MKTNSTNRKMKVFLSAILLLMGLGTSAHDFEVGGIYYSITSKENK